MFFISKTYYIIIKYAIGIKVREYMCWFVFYVLRQQKIKKRKTFSFFVIRFFLFFIFIKRKTNGHKYPRTDQTDMNTTDEIVYLKIACSSKRICTKHACIQCNTNMNIFRYVKIIMCDCVNCCTQYCQFCDILNN